MLCVLNVAYPLAPVGPHSIGGAEQVLSQIDQALAAAGHRSLVLACEGSQVRGALTAVRLPECTFDEDVQAEMRRVFRNEIARIVRREPVDLVHLHGVDFFHYLPPPGIRSLATLHLPVAWYPADVLSLVRSHTVLQCVSSHQRGSGSGLLDGCPVIGNGVPVGSLRPGGRRRSFAVSLGRICPEKGFHLALAAAERADCPLLLAGAVFPYRVHREYFDREIAPRLSPRRRFIGPVGPAAKRRLLASARCLLVPSLVDETSSLVAMEALACGTPVVAFRRGALSEVVDHGRTGFLVESVNEMAAAIPRCRALPARNCRQAAMARFSSARMCRDYLQLYEQLASAPEPVARLAAGAGRSV